jgi:hypothetical protein
MSKILVAELDTLSQRRPNINVTNEVKIIWANQDKFWWNEACIKVLETFGAPGKRYLTTVSEDHLTFKFHSDHDATICRLVLSEYI